MNVIFFFIKVQYINKKTFIILILFENKKLISYNLNNSNII